MPATGWSWKSCGWDCWVTVIVFARPGKKSPSGDRLREAGEEVAFLQVREQLGE